MNSLSWEGLKAKRDWTLNQRYTFGRNTLLSLTPASHCCKGHAAEPYSSVTPLEGIRYWALHQRQTAGCGDWTLHQRHTGKLPSPPHTSQHKSPHWYLACRVQISDWKTDILTVFMVVSRTCRKMSQLWSSPVKNASFHMLFNLLRSNYATTRRHSLGY
jgi:hypothetical protein